MPRTFLALFAVTPGTRARRRHRIGLIGVATGQCWPYSRRSARSTGLMSRRGDQEYGRFPTRFDQCPAGPSRAGPLNEIGRQRLCAPSNPATPGAQWQSALLVLPGFASCRGSQQRPGRHPFGELCGARLAQWRWSNAVVGVRRHGLGDHRVWPGQQSWQDAPGVGQPRDSDTRVRPAAVPCSFAPPHYEVTSVTRGLVSNSTVAFLTRNDYPEGIIQISIRYPAGLPMSRSAIPLRCCATPMADTRPCAGRSGTATSAYGAISAVLVLSTSVGSARAGCH